MFDVILDRDGTLNVDTGYVFRVSDFSFTPGCVQALQALRDADARLSIVTGQSGIARGKYTEADMHAFNAYLVEQLHASGIKVAAIAFCSHHPKVSDCDCRKPKTGMLQQIEQKLGGIDWKSAWGIGDKPADSEMIIAMGGRAVLLRPGPHNAPTGKVYWREDDSELAGLLLDKRNFVASNIREAVEIILEHQN